MNILFNIAISAIASFVIFVAGMNAPASNFSLKSLSEPIFGAFTEISTATNLADFPTTYNANLTKTIEVGTTSVASITTLAGLTSASALATIGTITSGTWNGTAIGVAYNGTGTTSPTLDQIILGNGASGFKVVSGFGSSGQFLTSGGAATAPTWTTSAIDQAANYAWTGLHAFNNASTTFNSIQYGWPVAQNASSTVLSKNATGQLSWNKAPIVFTQDSVDHFGINVATTSVATYRIPASTFGINGTLRYSVFFLSTSTVALQYGGVSFGDGTATTSIGFVNLGNNSQPTPTPYTASITGTIRNLNSASVQSIFGMGIGSGISTNAKIPLVATSTAYNTAATTYISIDIRAASDDILARGFTLEVIQ